MAHDSRNTNAARQRGGGHAAAHRSVLARSVIALYTRVTPIQFPIRKRGSFRPPLDAVFSGDQAAGFLSRTFNDPDRFGKVAFCYEH